MLFIYVKETYVYKYDTNISNSFNNTYASHQLSLQETLDIILAYVSKHAAIRNQFVQVQLISVSTVASPVSVETLKSMSVMPVESLKEFG